MPPILTPQPAGGGGGEPGPIGQFASTTTIQCNARTRYTRIWNQTARTIDRLGVLISTSSGNIDLAVYDGTDTAPADRLVSVGSTASPGTGVRRFPCATTVLPVGWLWFALAADNGTFLGRGWASGSAEQLNLGPDTSTTFPLVSEAGFPCPATAAAVDASFQLPVVWAEQA